MQKLTLNDGTVIENAHAISSAGVLWVYIDKGLTFMQAVELLGDPDRTQTITDDNYGVITEHTGYTDLFCLRVEDDGQINAGIKKGVIDNVDG